jgi:hypothetical protein
MKFPLYRHRNALAAALLFLPTALPQAPKPNTPPPPVPQGKLDIRMLITAEPQQVFNPTKGPDGKFKEAPPVKIAPRGKEIAAVIFFKDCKPDAAGNCNVDVDLHGVDPRGTVFENRKGAPLWRGVKAPPPGFVRLGSTYVKLQLEAADPAGIYKLTAVAHDRNAGIDVRAETSFEVR